MERYIEDTLNRAMGLRKNANFALNNALSFVLSKRGINPDTWDKFNINFDDENDSYKIYFKGKELGMDIPELDGLDNIKFNELINEGGSTRNDMLMSETDFKM